MVSYHIVHTETHTYTYPAIVL